jgi:hypothetical protein
MKPALQLTLTALSALALTSCVTTSLSDPNGSGHAQDLSVYELTSEQPGRAISEADIARGSSRQGSLPPRGARVLLVQSGAHQPDAQLVAAYSPYCQPVVWNGQNTNTESEKTAAGAAAGRRLRLAAAQQGCSHVIVVFGEIQSDSRDLPTSILSWVPIAGEILPSEHSGTRLLAQAVVMETRSPRYTMITAQPQQREGITTSHGSSGINGRRAEKLKALAYPDLARQSFR